MVPNWRMYIPSNTSAAPSQMTATDDILGRYLLLKRLQDTATDRSTWRRTIHERLLYLCRHAARNVTPSTSQNTYMCQHRGRTCNSHIGILSHNAIDNRGIKQVML